MALLVAPVAAAGVPVSLPAQESLSAWEHAASVAQVDWVPASAATVQITDLGLQWELRCACSGASRSVRVNEPHSAAERLDVAVMARAIGRDLRTHTPPAHMAPPPPMVHSEPEPVAPQAAAAPSVEPPQLQVSVERPVVSSVRSPLPALPPAPPRPVLPDFHPPARALALPHLWAGLGVGLRPQTNPSLRVSGGVTVLSGRRLSMGVSATANTARSLSGFNKRPWHNRKMWEAGAHIHGAMHASDWLQFDVGLGATRQAYHQNNRPLLAVTVPQLTADVELYTPGDRKLGVRLGGTADLRGVALVDELTGQQQWLVPFEFSASVVARIGHRADPRDLDPTPTEHRSDSAGLFSSDDLP